MTDATAGSTAARARAEDAKATGPVLAADGTPLKRSLARALRLQKLRALALIAPLLLFVLVTFIAPIADMLFRSVENQIVSNTLPRTTERLADWDATSGELPEPAVFEALFFDMFVAAEAKEHTKLGSRLNYEQTGMSSMFRSSGRKLDDVGKGYLRDLKKINKGWDDGAFWHALMQGDTSAARDNAPLDAARASYAAMTDSETRGDLGVTLSAEIAGLLPRTAEAYADFAVFTVFADGDEVAKEDPWEAVHVALVMDLQAPGAAEKVAAYDGPNSVDLQEAASYAAGIDPPDLRAAFVDIDEDWGDADNWRTIQVYSPAYTSGYFLNAIDMQKGPDGAEARPENQQIYLMLFQRTLFMSLLITASCIVLGYPVAWLLANLPMRTANLLMILVLLPFWTSLLVRTSAWKVMLQQQGVINDVLVWLGLVNDADRLIMINNQFGTVVAMTHILLPFMILPMYSVMQTIPPSYLRAAKSLGATNWTAFWRVYFPQSVPGIGAGSILVFILAIGYYITPEIVGGTTGTFISNRIAYHISSSLNWGLGAALGAILLGVVLILYWAYDKIVGIDNVKLG
jgi:putative spermidine/putrescine transport system permease protein